MRGQALVRKAIAIIVATLYLSIAQRALSADSSYADAIKLFNEKVQSVSADVQERFYKGSNERRRLSLRRACMLLHARLCRSKSALHLCHEKLS